MEKTAVCSGAAAGVSHPHVRLYCEAGSYLAQLRRYAEVIHRAGRSNDTTEFSRDVQARQKIAAPGEGVDNLEVLPERRLVLIERSANRFSKAQRT